MQINPEQTHGFTHAIQGLLTQKQLDDAVNEASARRQPLLHFLANEKLLNPETMAKAIADYFNLEYVDLTNYQNKELPIENFYQEHLQHYAALPLEKKDDTLIVAISDPHHFHLIESIKFQTKLKIQTVIAPYDQLTTFINKIINDLFQKDFLSPKNNSREASAVALIDRILTDAVYRQASDIHFEPMQHRYRIRIRIDGILHETIQPPIQLSTMIASRLKIMAALDISEKRLPQDGRFTFSLKTGLNRDCRLSTCPTLFGEKLVVRILNPHKHLLSVEELGLNEKSKRLFIDAIQKPQGLILVTGPTGSGKTITLYTALNMLNDIHKNIVSIEDPVEIQLNGINQVNVHPKAGLNFSKALRAFLRQDPDIIMVGEIRDEETANMAIRAAQTGHLVLTTLHTNSAAEALTRLVNMGVAPYNIASSVNLIVAQRLVRKTCLHCLSSGCQFCMSGYKGRTGVFETLGISSAIKKLIASNASAHRLAEQAQQEGMQSLWDAASDKVKAGITTPAEIIRVIERS